MSYKVLDTVFDSNVNNMVLVAINYCEDGGNSDDGGKVFECCKLVMGSSVPEGEGSYVAW